MLRFNDTLALVGHFASSPKEREKEIEEIVEKIKEGTGKKEEIE